VIAPNDGSTRPGSDPVNDVDDKPPRSVPAEPAPPADGAFDTRRVLTDVEAVAYDWSILDDAIRWDSNAAGVFGLESTAPIATGHRYAALLDPSSLANRHDAVMNSGATDTGSGVIFEAEYGLLPEGPHGRHLVVEDVGRWFADENGRPRRARGMVRIVTERYERRQRVAFLSRYDELTGYLNRTHLLSTLDEALTTARRLQTSMAFVVVAIDNVRAINEAYGFEVADRVFAAVAHRIKATLRQGDAIGRFSGTRLGVILLHCDERDMHIAAERFHAAVRGDIVATDSGSVAVTASIGAVSLPRHGRTVGEAIARAQEALHLAQRRGHGHVTTYFHSAERAERRRANAELSSDLVAAYAENRFVLGFQPIVEATSRRVAFHEALLRMRRLNNPVTCAGDFVELAERLGLIRLIDERAMELVVETLMRDQDVRLSLNISAQTVGDGDWLARFATRVGEHPDVARRLMVEITETALVHNLEEGALFVARLRELGCQVALDDFGAGFSSFKILSRLGVDVVKIDGGFVENIVRDRDDRAFVRALVDLAGAVGLKTVAERVQDEETVTLLTEFGVDYLQGNLTGQATLQWPEPAIEGAG